MQLLTYKEVGKKLSINPMSVYRYMKTDDTFPKPLKLTENTNRWVESDIDNWIKSKQGVTNDHRNSGEETSGN